MQPSYGLKKRPDKKKYNGILKLSKASCNANCAPPKKALLA